MQEGEVQLAAAVIGLAIKELRHGTSEERVHARVDILQGRLDYWVDVISERYEVADYLRQELRRLAEAMAA